MTNKMEVDDPKDKVERKRVVHAVKVIKKLHSKWLEEEATKKPLLESTEDTPLLLQITLKKIPCKSNVQMVKIPLPHSLVTDITEVCLITGDLDKRDKKADIDLTVQHYKDLLRKHNVNCISEVVPLRQLRTDYKPFEAKRQLLGAYDVFLTDQKIAQCLPKVLGKSFFKKRKFPQQIDLKSKNLKEQIEKTLSNTVLFISGHGSSCSMEVGRLGFSTKKMVKNIMTVVAALHQKLPDSWGNVYGIYVKTPKSMALPIYLSFDFPEMSSSTSGSMPVQNEFTNRIQKNKKVSSPEDKLKRATKKKKIAQKKQEKERQIIIRNLSFKINEKELKNILSKYGNVTDLKIPKKLDGMKKGFAFAQFEKFQSTMQAIKNLNYKELHGRPIAIDYALPKDKYENINFSKVKKDQDSTPDDKSVKDESSSESEASDDENLDADVEEDDEDNANDKSSNNNEDRVDDLLKELEFNDTDDEIEGGDNEDASLSQTFLKMKMAKTKTGVMKKRRL